MPAAPPPPPSAPPPDAARLAESRAALATAEERVFVASDGRPLFVRRYEPDGPARGTILWLHGVRSHSGWYGWSGRELAAAGWRVLAADRRGAGRNGAGRGDAAGADRLLSDVRQLAAVARSLSPGSPLVLAGVSWGAKPAAILAAEAGSCAGLLLVNPGLRSRFGPGPAARAAVRAAVAAGRGGVPARVPLESPRLFTSSPAFAEFVERDPLAVRTVTLRFVAATAALDRRVPAAVAGLRVPVLCLLAGEDGVVDNPATRRLLGTSGSADVTVREVPAARHTLEFELTRAAWLAGAAAWLDRLTQPIR